MLDLAILVLNLSWGAHIKHKPIFMQRCSLSIKQIHKGHALMNKPILIDVDKAVKYKNDYI